MERHPRTSPIRGSAPALVPRPQAQRPCTYACATLAHARRPKRGERWRGPASQRRCTDMWAAAPSATCTSPRRTLFCCWTHSKQRRPNSRGARRAGSPRERARESWRGGGPGPRQGLSLPSPRGGGVGPPGDSWHQNTVTEGFPVDTHNQCGRELAAFFPRCCSGFRGSVLPHHFRCIISYQLLIWRAWRVAIL